jgi:chromosomal replication initiation ATPase DnaA
MAGRNPSSGANRVPSIELKIALKPGYERENFFVSDSNETAHAIIAGLAGRPRCMPASNPQSAAIVDQAT